MTAGVTDEHQDLVQEAIRLRGLYVHRYSGMEFSWTHLITAARGHPHYHHLGDTPFSLPSKIKRLHALADGEGPISKHAPELKRLIAAFEGFEEDRHFMVHALLATKMKVGQRVLVAKLYNYQKGSNVLHEGTLRMTLEEMEAMVASLHPTSYEIPVLVSRIVKENLTP